MIDRYYNMPNDINMFLNFKDFTLLQMKTFILVVSHISKISYKEFGVEKQEKGYIIYLDYETIKNEYYAISKKRSRKSFSKDLTAVSNVRYFTGFDEKGDIMLSSLFKIELNLYKSDYISLIIDDKHFEIFENIIRYVDENKDELRVKGYSSMHITDLCEQDSIYSFRTLLLLGMSMNKKPIIKGECVTSIPMDLYRFMLNIPDNISDTHVIREHGRVIIRELNSLFNDLTIKKIIRDNIELVEFRWRKCHMVKHNMSRQYY